MYMNYVILTTNLLSQSGGWTSSCGADTCGEGVGGDGGGGANQGKADVERNAWRCHSSSDSFPGQQLLI